MSGQILIGENAEHFVFAYLQKCYGTEFITPTRDWRSSIRLKAYPDSNDDVDNAAGYDFDLHDTDEMFARGLCSQTKHCFFVVKGTNGSFKEDKTRFHISENELNKCKDIACNDSRLKCDAYFIVIVQYCLYSKKISLGDIINWSENFERVRGTVDSHVCSIVQTSSLNSNDIERNGSDYERGQRRTSENARNNHETRHLSSTNNQAYNSGRYVIPQKRDSSSKRSINTDRTMKDRHMCRSNNTRRS